MNDKFRLDLALANLIIERRCNGALFGTSASKGGRAWLDGEWCLAELEALCIRIRYEAGENAEGIKELLELYPEDYGIVSA